MKIPSYFFKFDFIKIFLIFSYIVCWLSISTSFQDFLIFKEEVFYGKLNIQNLISFKSINFIRHGFVYLSLFFLIILFFSMKKEFFVKKNFFYFIILLYFIFQIPGLVSTYNNFENISFIVSSVAIILTIILINDYFLPNEKKYFIFISFFILSLIFSLTFFPRIYHVLIGEKVMYGEYFDASKTFLNKTSPRSSGLSRSSLILLLLSIPIFNLYFKSKNLLFFLKIFFLIIILLYQSRLIIFLLFFTLIVIFIFQKNFSLKHLLTEIILYFLIPIAIFLSISYFTINKHAIKLTNDENQLLGKKLANEPDERFKKPIVRQFFPDDFSSGRFNDWHSIIKIIEKDKVFFGYGAQADRYLINQSASNGLIYAYASSGIIGSLFFIIFSVMIFFKSLKCIISSYRNDNLNYIYGLIILIILARSIFETSYAVFSIDLIIILTSLIFLEKSNLSIKK